MSATQASSPALAVELQGQILTLAQTSSTGLDFREAAVDLLIKHVAADVVFFHAFSPRVPLSTAVVRGIDPSTLLDVGSWDALAVEFAALRSYALTHRGVVTDDEVIPLKGRLRTRYREVFAKTISVQHIAMLHLVVRERVHGALLLGRRYGCFTYQEAALLRSIAGCLSICDTLAQRLDDQVGVALTTTIRCVDERLTPRQREVVEHVARGLTNPQIADALGITINTVRNRLAAIFARIGAGSRAELVTLAVLR